MKADILKLLGKEDFRTWNSVAFLHRLAPILSELKAIAHITGGGIPGNLPRVLPETVSVELDWGAWRVPPIFAFLQDVAGARIDAHAAGGRRDDRAGGRIHRRPR